MGKWLVMVEPKTDLAAVYEKLAKAGGVVNKSQKPIPYEGGDLTIEVEGPPDLLERLKDEKGITIYPSSDMTLY